MSGTRFVADLCKWATGDNGNDMLFVNSKQKNMSVR